MYAPHPGYPPPPYMMLQQPPPYYHSGYKRRSGCGSCCRCFCCFICCLLVLLMILGILLAYLYMIYDPKIPTYKVEGMEVKALDIQPDFSVNSELLITVKAENPNKKIGFIYGTDSSVMVSYSDTTLCSGNLPSFHQEHRNTTLIQVNLKGKANLGQGLQQTLMENQKDKKIPLAVHVKVPVRIQLGSLRLKELTVVVTCSLVVDNVLPNAPISIVSSDTSVKFRM
ncbi:hypothetical protein BUALT_Bualt18G0023800 [Buddleja alternifolia]|uniref:Late embryogenesis abundant protein LEA-2 subgroup domain-containing protein n=1 Tax=Buddleja alternifolia TaxID=168488 RepID=A0AAV6W9W8_9LAMI|nr:hypothetical protein BUALT_Bualt18G0023800 [Buddleja alternifolia]